MKLINTETSNMSQINVFNEFPYERELKYLTYNLVLEVKSLIVIICQKDFINELKDDNFTQLAEQIRK